MAEFKLQLKESGQPLPQGPCFCISPKIQFLKGKDVLVSIELTHDRHARFSALTQLGDFVLPTSNYAALAKLERSALALAVSFPKQLAQDRPSPTRIELKP